MKQSGVIVMLLLVGATMSSACTIPVFRYALDRWPADPYGLAVNDEWARSETGEAFWKSLGDLAYRFQLVPDEKPPGELDVLIPARGAVPVWSGAADADALKQLASSPAREQVVKGILAGNSAVWIVVRGNDAERSDRFEKRLEERLEYLASVAAIPPQDPFDPESRLGPGPALRVGFETIVLERGNAREQMLIRMTAGPEGDTLLASGSPFAAPVFGRGRVLGAFTDEELDQEGIDELCLFLLGACSCQVKAQNPGWDLLLNTDWDTELMAVAMAGDAEEQTESPTGTAEQQGDEKAAADEAPEMIVFDGKAASAAKTMVAAADRPARELVLGLGLLAMVLIWLGWKSGS